MTLFTSMMILTMAAAGDPSIPGKANTPQPASTLSASMVLNKIHAINQHEIEGGKIAQKRGADAKVRDFGKLMVHDHTDADAQVSQVAKDLKVKLTDPPKHDMDKMHALSKLSGSAFDRQYLTMMSAGHADALKFLQDVKAQANEPRLQDLATKLIPTVQGHKEMADSDLQVLNSSASAQ